ncbi:MAG: flavodoxin family protein, partial [Pseudomonadota bacterium]
VHLKAAGDVKEQDVLDADGVIAGSPVQMSNVNWEMKKLIDTVFGPLWMRDALVGKVGAVFATGGGFGNAGAGNEHVMISLLNNFAECGMILIPLPKTTPGYAYGGLQWGPYARSAGVHMEQTGIKDDMLEVAKEHGAHVAKASALLAGNTIFAKP